MIEMRGGTKKFLNNAVFSDATLSFEPGTYYTLTGPNGSGKSTLMSCFLRQAELTEGQLLLDGTVITAGDAVYAREVFGINDAIGWLPGMTVGQHLEMLATHAPPYPGFIPLSPQEALAELGIAQAYRREPYTLSSGQEQRARLTTLLMRGARYYFLDEPEKRLDTDGVTWIADWAQQTVENGAMVCIATHDPLLNRVPGTVNVQFPLPGSSMLLDADTTEHGEEL